MTSSSDSTPSPTTSVPPTRSLLRLCLLPSFAPFLELGLCQGVVGRGPGAPTSTLLVCRCQGLRGASSSSLAHTRAMLQSPPDAGDAHAHTRTHTCMYTNTLSWLSSNKVFIHTHVHTHTFFLRLFLSFDSAFASTLSWLNNNKVFIHTNTHTHTQKQR